MNGRIFAWTLGAGVTLFLLLTKNLGAEIKIHLIALAAESGTTGPGQIEKFWTPDGVLDEDAGEINMDEEVYDDLYIDDDVPTPSMMAQNILTQEFSNLRIRPVVIFPDNADLR